MSDRIRGRVAKLLDKQTVVINRGTDDGVALGMKFAVLNPPAPIVDPETGEAIGEADVDKVVVKVVRVDARIAVARTFRTFSTGMAAIMGNLNERTLETITVGDTTYRQELQDHRTVKVGDEVIEVQGEEFGD